MLVGQFKRAQSELTRGNAYQKNYHRRFEKDFGTDNLLSYLIYMGTMKSLWTLRKELWLETAMNLRS
jgi:anthranilate/para-aminobenzoate synthase component I